MSEKRSVLKYSILHIAWYEKYANIVGETLLSYYYLLFLRELFSMGQHYSKTVPEGADNNMFSIPV